jgi:hypothetical protein
MKPYTLSIYESVERAWVAAEQQCSLQELGEILTEYTKLAVKEDGILFNLAKFKSVEEDAEPARRYHYVDGIKQDTYSTIPNTVRRCRANLVSIGGLVLDVDNQHSIEDIIKLLDGVHMIIYTTYRHTWAHNKFRVVIPFSRPLLAEDIAGRERSIIETFPGVDHASFSVSQSFYFHGSNNEAEAFSCVVEGELVDPYDFEIEEIVEWVPAEAPSTGEISDSYKRMIVEALLTCSGVHYDSQSGSRNGGVLTLVAICRSVGLTFEEFDAICCAICAGNSQLVHREVRRGAWTGWKGDKITRDKRNEFIKSNGGKVPERVERHNNSIMDKAVRDLQKIIKNIT